jgi:hypothetical protein
MIGHFFISIASKAAAKVRGEKAAEDEATTMDKDRERREQLLSLWKQRPDGKRTENDVIEFYGQLERDFPHLLKRQHDPYRNLHVDLKGHIEERKNR